MSSTPKMDDALRAVILSQPDVILDDKDVMNALVGANDRAMGDNVVDMRGIAMERMEQRLDQLEDTHRSVIAAAYDNLAGTNQIHRAILRVLDPTDLATLLTDLPGDIADILRINAVKLVLERPQDAPPLDGMDDTLAIAEPGFIDGYLNHNRQGSARQVTLRHVERGSDQLFGNRAAWIKSEACLLLETGPQHLQAMLVLGSEDEKMFGPQQGTDLLAVFAGVCERVIRRWMP
ncbi:DUF484 family protein [Roseobacter sp.]|uniref:DUF484 family protein n=1 Tax=Roseobacter sp. TaxID=1907202 RepID=UPI0032976BEA